jgi:hypothetical protein
MIPVGIHGHAKGRLTPSAPLDPTRDDRGRPTLPPPHTPPYSLFLQTKKKDMIVTTLRRGLLRTHAPHRRLPFSTSSTSSSSTSSSTSSSSSAAQKKAQDALGNVSAVLVRAGAYARSALGPFGARFSSLLGCPYLLSLYSLPSFSLFPNEA